jgi:hypothetical protein
MATKTIIQKLIDKKAEVEADETGALDSDLRYKALAAILKGVTAPDGSPTAEWETFMKAMIGEDSPEQLARLTLQDDLGADPDIQYNVAYLVSNVVCTIISGVRFPSDLSDVIDAGIPIEANPG